LSLPEKSTLKGVMERSNSGEKKERRIKLGKLFGTRVRRKKWGVSGNMPGNGKPSFKSIQKGKNLENRKDYAELGQKYRTEMKQQGEVIFGKRMSYTKLKTNILKHKRAPQRETFIKLRHGKRRSHKRKKGGALVRSDHNREKLGQAPTQGGSSETAL